MDGGLLAVVFTPPPRSLPSLSLALSLDHVRLYGAGAGTGLEYLWDWGWGSYRWSRGFIYVCMYVCMDEWLGGLAVCIY
jgi:hypothetical protein